MSSDKHRREHLVRRVAFWGVLALAAGVIALIVWQMANQTKSTKKQNPQQITMVKPLPPPPPPKPPEQKPPEVKKEEVKIEEKVETPKNEPQPQQQAERPLGIDADGAAGNDGFGLAANRGGRDITTIGGGAGSGGDAFRHGHFFGALKRHLDDVAQRNRELQGRNYQVSIGLWLDRAGNVQRYELLGSTGDARIDSALKQTLDTLPPMREPPPADLPQPIVLRMSSRGA